MSDTEACSSENINIALCCQHDNKDHVMMRRLLFKPKSPSFLKSNYGHDSHYSNHDDKDGYVVAHRVCMVIIVTMTTKVSYGCKLFKAHLLKSKQTL